jgi:hypothetical protein
MYPDEEEVLDPLATLGEPKAEFAVRGWTLIRNIILAPLLIVAGIAIEILVFCFLHHSFEIIMLGAGLTLTGIMLVVRAYRNRGLRVLVFAEGVVRVCRGEGQAMLWEEIDTLWRKKTEGHWEIIWKGSLSYIIESAGGKKIQFDDAIPKLADLGKILQKETFPYLWQRYLAAYEKGSTLDFHKIRVNQTSLSADSGKLAWSEVQEIKFDENQLTVTKKGKWTSWFQCKVADLPNYHVCKPLIERALASRGTRAVKT